MSAKVAGYCPMGCGDTLFLGSGGYVTCSLDKCPRPDAAADVLAERESHHIVKFETNTFTVRHPLRERLDDALMTCDLHDHIVSLSGPPVQPGRYRAVFSAVTGGWAWQKLEVSDGH